MKLILIKKHNIYEQNFVLDNMTQTVSRHHEYLHHK